MQNIRRAIIKVARKIYAFIAALIIMPFAIATIICLCAISIWIGIAGWVEEKIIPDG